MPEKAPFTSFWPGFAESRAQFVEAYDIHADGRAAERMVAAVESRMGGFSPWRDGEAPPEPAGSRAQP